MRLTLESRSVAVSAPTEVLFVPWTVARKRHTQGHGASVTITGGGTMVVQKKARSLRDSTDTVMDLKYAQSAGSGLVMVHLEEAGRGATNAGRRANTE
jgi:hypothetical protein